MAEDQEASVPIEHVEQAPSTPASGESLGVEHLEPAENAYSQDTRER